MRTVCEAVKERVLFLMKEYNINQHQLSLRSGVSHGTMSGIMLVKNKSVDLLTIIKIASGFGITASEFLDDNIFYEDNINGA